MKAERNRHSATTVRSDGGVVNRSARSAPALLKLRGSARRCYRAAVGRGQFALVGMHFAQQSRTMSLIKHCSAAAWLALAGAGSWAMMRYENAPGAAGRPPREWPGASRLERGVDQPTLVLVAHPHCPCTRATLGELAILLARCPGYRTDLCPFQQTARNRGGLGKDGPMAKRCGDPGHDGGCG